MPRSTSLLYGTPVPGYQAPETTIGPASRVTFALLGIVDDAWRSDGIIDGAPITLSAPLEADLARATELPAELVARTVAAWTQLFGLVSFELFGQTKNVIYAHEDLMRSTAEAMASFIGLAG
ncbi:MAG: TetR-like C-terminal domain-containing protein [Ilumatobacteraceae bacterium]